MSRFVRDPRAGEKIAKDVQPWTVRVARTLARDIQSRAAATDMGIIKAGYSTGAMPRGDGARITVDSPFWHWIEFGTVTTQAWQPIRRSLSIPGVKWTDSR